LPTGSKSPTDALADTIGLLAADARQWWAAQKPMYALEARNRLLKATFVLGVAATIANKAARAVESWGMTNVK
jgi:hypothetical protein